MTSLILDIPVASTRSRFVYVDSRDRVINRYKTASKKARHALT